MPLHELALMSGLRVLTRSLIDFNRFPVTCPIGVSLPGLDCVFNALESLNQLLLDLLALTADRVTTSAVNYTVLITSVSAMV